MGAGAAHPTTILLEILALGIEKMGPLRFSLLFCRARRDYRHPLQSGAPLSPS